MKKFKLILTTICCLVGLGSFCVAGFIDSYSRNQETSANTTAREYDAGTGRCYMRTASTNVYYSLDNWNTQTLMEQHGIYCFTGLVYMKSQSSTVNIYYYDIDLTESLCPPCDCEQCIPCEPIGMTSLECQSEYNLIPVSSVDSTYCENNNLCSSSSVDCPSGDYSSIYVNGVLHDPAPIIDIQISDEIDWDYAYSGSGSQFNLDIVGYNVDYEKMEEVLLVQNYVPSSEDFTNLISSLVPYMKILVFVLFAYIVIKRLKKPFSSKFK